MIFSLSICSILWLTAILYALIYTIAMLYVIRVNRCRFNRTNKAILLTFWLIFAVTVAGSTLSVLTE